MKRRDNKKTVTLYNGKEAKILETCIVIDPDKLRQLIEEKGLSVPQMSEQMGYEKQTLSTSINGGYISRPMSMMLHAFHGIKKEDYELKPDEPKAEEPVEEKPEEVQTEMKIEPDDMYKTIKTAVLDAINEALAGNMKNLRGMVYTAITQAKQ